MTADRYPDYGHVVFLAGADCGSF